MKRHVIRMDDELAERVNELAERDERSVSRWLARVIRDEVERLEVVQDEAALDDPVLVVPPGEEPKPVCSGRYDQSTKGQPALDNPCLACGLPSRAHAKNLR